MPAREALRGLMQGHTTVAAPIARDLAAYGPRQCFGLPGTADFKVSDALVGPASS